MTVQQVYNILRVFKFWSVNMNEAQLSILSANVILKRCSITSYRLDNNSQKKDNNSQKKTGGL